MCGFVGLVSQSYCEKQLDTKIKLMNGFISHRGPDDEGYFINKNIGLGHRRLSVLDTSKNGSQPMIEASTGDVLVFNGEIYNYRELKENLESRGEVFFSETDSEIILKQYKHYGLEGLYELEGMFAFSILDRKKNQTIIFRDRLGIKPIFFVKEKEFFAFSSEIKSLLPLIKRKEINDQAFSEYLFYGNSYEDKTIYKNINSLGPGNLLIYKIFSENLSIKNWWKIEDWIEEGKYFPSNASQRFLEEELQKIVDKSIERQLVSDVPLGLFLSGGLDSSTIAASSRKLSNNTINSFIALFDYEKGINERDKSHQVAKKLALNHKEIFVPGDKIINAIDKLAYYHDEPFADAANIPLYLMTKKLKGLITVILQGDGGDELFSGYPRNKIISNLDILKFLPSISFLPEKIGKKISFKRLIRISEAINSESFGEIMAKLLTTETLKDHPFNFFKIEKKNYLLKRTNPFNPYLNCNERFKKFSKSKKMMLTDLTLQLPSQFLTKVDRASMANGLEVRVPMLDENLLKFSINLPESKLFSRTKDKILIRKILKKRLGKEISNQKKKGFGVPYEFWMKTSLYDYSYERLTDDSFINYFDLEKKEIEKSLSLHKNSLKEQGFILWKLLQLSLWKENHLKGI